MAIAADFTIAPLYRAAIGTQCDPKLGEDMTRYLG